LLRKFVEIARNCSTFACDVGERVQICRFGVGVLKCFVPKLSWTLEELRLSMFTDGATPGGMYGPLRRGTEVLCLAFGVGAILFSVFG
jgi:hypothetical protein